jgi:hypothetical protein
MRNRLSRITRVLTLVGVAALAGCASVQTTDQYAASKGYVAVHAQGRKFFCRADQTAPAARNSSAARCVTRAQVLEAMYAGSPPNDGCIGSSCSSSHGAPGVGFVSPSTGSYEPVYSAGRY